ncbi:MAG: chromate transporter [Erysipelotrichaceae bacterium]|nr:chromate transporter [Erysipelotrichaceae bacterium]
MIYLRLFIEFLKVGFFSFGGGYGAIAIIRDVVISNNWLTDDGLAYMIALSESTPGPIMVNLATYVGSVNGGLLGALVATIGVIFPAFIIIILVVKVLSSIMNNKYFKYLMDGAILAVIGIILATGLYMLMENNSMIEIVISIILLFTLLVVKVKKIILNPIMFICYSAMIGVIVNIVIQRVL